MHLSLTDLILKLKHFVTFSSTPLNSAFLCLSDIFLKTYRRRGEEKLEIIPFVEIHDEIPINAQGGGE